MRKYLSMRNIWQQLNSSVNCQLSEVYRLFFNTQHIKMGIKKDSYCSQSQKQMLIETLNTPSYSVLKTGKFTSSFTYKDAQKKWEEIGELLNSIPGSKKDWKQWRKSWQDIRTKTKSKKCKNTKYCFGTGGGPSAPDLTEMDEKVSSFMSSTEILGCPDVSETSINFHIDGANEVDVYPVEDIETTIMRDPACEVVFDNTNDHTYINNIEIHKEDHKENKTRTEKQNTTNSQRLKNSTIATETLAEVATNKLDIKKKYYYKKLLILERQVVALENIALALKDK